MQRLVKGLDKGDDRLVPGSTSGLAGLQLCAAACNICYLSRAVDTRRLTSATSPYTFADDARTMLALESLVEPSHLWPPAGYLSGVMQASLRQ